MLRWFRSSASSTSAITKGLPRPSGPYSVGFLDLEWQPVASKYVTHPPEYVLARLYYPSLPITHHEQGSDDALTPEWSGRSHWIPSPAYFPGYGYYLKMPWYVASPLFRLLAGNTPIWAVEGAPLTDLDRLSQFPLIVFSHGLGGMRTTYSTLCTDLASHGFVVAALEHRLAKRTWMGWREWLIRLWATPTYSEQFLLISQLSSSSSFRDGSASMSWMPQDETVLQYKHLPPQWDEQQAHQFRIDQLQHRRQEVSALIDILLGELSAQDPLLENLWNSRSGSETSTRTDIGNVLPELKKRLDRTGLVMAGHSFGAATTFLAAHEDERIQAGLALDPWMYPLSNSFLQEGIGRPIPLLIITTERFNWPGNKEAIAMALRTHHRNQGHVCQVTVKGSSHLDQSDFTVLVPDWLLRRYRAVSGTNPRAILHLNTRLIRAFVDRVVGRADDPLEVQLQGLIWEKDPEERKKINIEGLLVEF